MVGIIKLNKYLKPERSTVKNKPKNLACGICFVHTDISPIHLTVSPIDWLGQPGWYLELARRSVYLYKKGILIFKKRHNEKE